MTAGGTTFGGRPRTFRYLPLGRFYLNDRTGPVRAWRLLWEQQSDFLGSEGKQVGDPGTLSGERPRKALATAKLVLRYLGARVLPPRNVLELPLSGDLAIVRLSGAVKLLDVAQRRVYTVMYRQGAREKLEERVAAVKRVAEWPFAPCFEGADLEAGWLAEEYIPGSHPTGFRGCRDCFEEYYLPLLADFLLAEQPLEVSFAEYVSSLRHDILHPAGLLSRVEGKLRDEITGFVGELMLRLRGSQRFDTRRLALTLSHGDFFSGNVILSPTHGPRAIDWATTGSRSPTYDLYYLVMNHCVRVMEPLEQHERFGQMLGALRERLSSEAPGVAAALEGGLSDASELRWLFYLECIHMPLMHCDDPDDRYIKSLATRIGWFKDFERAMEDASLPYQPRSVQAASAPTAQAGARDA